MTLSLKKNPFTLLLVSLAMFIFVLFPTRQVTDVGFGILDIVTAGLLITAIYAISRNYITLIIAVLLALPWFVTRVGYYFSVSDTLVVTGRVFTAAFLIFTAIVVLVQILGDKNVTIDTISGAVAIYLLVGVAWAFVFAIIEVSQPGSFSLSEADLVRTMNDRIRMESFVYFSFTTLTTLGYGDIVPLTAHARASATLEAVVGQLYLAIMVARLVGLNISFSQRS